MKTAIIILSIVALAGAGIWFASTKKKRDISILSREALMQALVKEAAVDYNSLLKNSDDQLRAFLLTVRS